MSARSAPRPASVPFGSPRMGPRQLFFSLVFLSNFCGLALACELFWTGKQSLGYESGIQLQVCCGVSRVRIWPLGKNFAVGEKAIDQEFPDPKDDMWAELQLSICSDRREATIGWVIGRPGVTCEHKTGQTLTLSPASLPLPGWYVVCYVLKDGCQTCSIETLCSNDLSEACSAVSVLGSSPSASNSTIKYWTKVGSSYPFPASSSSIELTVQNARNREQVTKKTIPMRIGNKTDIVLDGLKDNEIYMVRRCTLIDLPSSLTNDPRFKFASKRSTICVEEGYRTERASSTLVISSLLALLILIHAL